MKQSILSMIDEKLPGIKGKWRLTYHCRGSELDNFGGRTIQAYKNPKTFQVVERTDPMGEAIPYLFMDQLMMDFDPDNNPQHRVDVAWLIHHPEVKIEGWDKVPEVYKKAKLDSAPYSLVAMDYQEIEEIKRDDYIDKLVGRVSKDNGTGALGREKLRWVNSALGLVYRDDRYITNTEVEKGILRKTLKKYIRASYNNAKEVNKILENLDYAETEFTVKEMMRLGIISSNTNGVFKYQNIPFGRSVSDVLRFWEKDPDIKIEMMKELGDKEKSF